MQKKIPSCNTVLNITEHTSMLGTWQNMVFFTSAHMYQDLSILLMTQVSF